MGKRVIFLLCMALLAPALLAGCSGQEQPEPVEYVVGVSQANMREPWRLVLAEQLLEEAGQYPQLRLVFADATSDPAKQIEDIARLQEYGIDLLIVSPSDAEELTPVISQVYQEIPVIVLDRMVEGFDYTLFIGPDNELVGRKAGQAVLDLAGERGSTVLELQGNPDTKSTQDRTWGFLQALGGAHTVVPMSVEEESRDAAEDLVLALGGQLEHVDIIFAHNDYMALGAYNALEALGYGHISIVGIDGFVGESGGLDMIRSGLIDRTVTCPTGGQEAIRYALDILDGVSGIPKQIILRSTLIDGDNLEEYERELGRPITEPSDTLRVGYAQLGTESGWRLANNLSIVQAAEDFGVELTVMDADQSQERQIEHLRTFIAEGMDVIVLSPVVATGWDEVLEEARAAGIPVLLSDRSVEVADDTLYETCISADFLEEGRRAMRWIEANISPADTGGQVGILEIQGTPDATPTTLRQAGFAQYLEGLPQYEIVCSGVGDYTVEGGRQVVEDVLDQYGGQIDVIYSHNDDMALGAIEALEARGIAPGEDIAIVSVDGTRAAVEALAEGRMNCVVECSPMLGPQLMKAIMDLSAGRKLPLRIVTDEIVFTEENARDEVEFRTY